MSESEPAKTYCCHEDAVIFCFTCGAMTSLKKFYGSFLEKAEDGS